MRVCMCVYVKEERESGMGEVVGLKREIKNILKLIFFMCTRLYSDSYYNKEYRNTLVLWE